MLKSLSMSALLVATFLLAAPTGASTLLQVVELEQGQNINSVLELDVFDAIETSDLINEYGELLYSQSVYSDTEYQGCVFGSDTACSFTFDEDVEFVVFKAGNGYAALYEAWDGVVDVDVSTWGPLYNGGGKLFTPAISDLRAFTPVPEPSAAIVFASGTWLIALSIRRRAK